MVPEPLLPPVLVPVSTAIDHGEMVVVPRPFQMVYDTHNTSTDSPCLIQVTMSYCFSSHHEHHHQSQNYHQRPISTRDNDASTHAVARCSTTPTIISTNKNITANTKIATTNRSNRNGTSRSGRAYTAFNGQSFS